MAKRDWEFIGELVTAMARTNSLRTLPASIGQAFNSRWSARRVLLRVAKTGAVDSYEAKWTDSKWTSSHRPGNDSDRHAKRCPTVSFDDEETHLYLPLSLRGGSAELSIWCGVGDPVLASAEYLSSLVRIVEFGLEKQSLIQKVADLSQRAYRESRELRDSLEELEGRQKIVARSSQMQEVMRRLAMVARYDTSVLVLGASGTGKELISREIHRKSTRSRQSFVQVNCGAIPAQLIESELFGHEIGAFTGAVRTHRGVFEQAHRGVLFLDEVGELPPEVQVKLLRVLQEGRVRRVGAETEIVVDVRVVAATNRSLSQMVHDNTFREDLYFRLNVFSIEIPPLRERPEDIAPLVHHLLTVIAKKLRVQPLPTISSAVLAKLEAYSWPGNTRELANVLETSIILGHGHELELPANFGDGASVIREGEGIVHIPTTLDAAIRQAIESALRASGAKIYGANGAARALGLNPATLQSKMRKLGISRVAFLAR